MSKEDELVNALVRMAKESSLYDRVEVTPEAHYNNYGTRGVADLHIRAVEETEYGARYSDTVYEVKSESAVRSATGANEIIRQYNRMRENFYEDDRRKRPHNASFELVFEITPYTVQHVAENIEMYGAAEVSELYSHRGHGREMVTFRYADPENVAPARIRGLVENPPRDVRDWARRLSASTRGGKIDNAMSDVLAILGELYDHGLDPGR